MFWFDREDSRAVYLDKRKESHQLKDRSSSGGFRNLLIDPDIQADFTDLPFDDCSFQMVVFDPPHLVKNGNSGWLAKKYGKLGEKWQDDIRLGFLECFRVLRPGGTLIFKWNENDISVGKILALTDQKPIVGNKCGKQSKSHWIVFMKG